MTLVATQIYRDQWIVIDDDWFDGAPDAGAFRIRGLGNSKETAIEDLLQQMEEGAPWQQEMAREYRGNPGPGGSRQNT